MNIIISQMKKPLPGGCLPGKHPLLCECLLSPLGGLRNVNHGLRSSCSTMPSCPHTNSSMLPA